MQKIIDLHTHLNTIHPIAQLRSKIQGHVFHLDQHIKTDYQVILSVAMYAMPYEQYGGLKQMILDFHKEIKGYGDDVILIQSQSDLNKAFKIGIILHVESARTIKKFNEQIPELFDLGVRGVIPVHFIDNHLGSSCDDPLRRLKFKTTDKGLSKLGYEFVDKCNQYNIWLDLPHTTDRTGDEILNESKEVMISHVGLRDLVPWNRNKDLNFLKKIIEKKGIIGLTPWCHLVGGELWHYQTLIDKMIENGCEEGICIGTDFGAPIKTAKEIKSIFDIAKFIPNQKFLNENALRFFYRALPR